MPRSTPAIPDGRREQALGLLAAGVPIGEAARVVGIDRKTLRRWRAGSPSGAPHAPRGEVEAAAVSVAVARAEVLTTMAEGQRAMAAGIAECVDELLAQMRNQSLDARDRRAAACEILDRAGVVKQSHVEVSHIGAVAIDVTDFRARIERAYEAAKRAQSVEVAQGPQGVK